MQYIESIPVWGEHEPNTLEQAKVCARSADYFALMADGNLGYGVPFSVSLAGCRLPTRFSPSVADLPKSSRAGTAPGRRLARPRQPYPPETCRACTPI
jgi:hypothetical protein